MLTSSATPCEIYKLDKARSLLTSTKLEVRCNGMCIIRAVQGAPLTPWRVCSARRQNGSLVVGLLSAVVSVGDGRARSVSGLSWASGLDRLCCSHDLKALDVRLLKDVCSSSCQCVSKLAVVLREVLLRSSVGGVAYGNSKVMKRPSFPSSFLFPSSRCRPLECVDFLLDGFTPDCGCSSFILATGFSFRHQRLISFRFSEEATFEDLERLCFVSRIASLLGGLVGVGCTSQQQEHVVFMVVFASLLFCSYESRRDPRELATPATTWEFPASEVVALL
ncbi:unnamed protein product [Eruca vesicaria subsp. sativa]|uniref:Uncharacterized protein n=1 Tax=Eruca vesicaria subsp. sativa TaxID=29727 RepID=A0ABC8IW72_ERUVS|nr:unnamed protein product [Eruca vesicaria subsp. sativa]